MTCSDHSRESDRHWYIHDSVRWHLRVTVFRLHSSFNAGKPAIVKIVGFFLASDNGDFLTVATGVRWSWPRRGAAVANRAARRRSSSDTDHCITCKVALDSLCRTDLQATALANE